MAVVRVQIEVPERQQSRTATIDTAADPEQIAQEMAANLGLQGDYTLVPKGSLEVRSGTVLVLMPRAQAKSWSWAE